MSLSDLPNFSTSDQKSIPFDGRYLRPGDLVDAPNPQMPTLDAVFTRRTSRRYADQLVDDNTFEWLVDASMNAPTACNEQQWKLILIDDPKVIEEFYERDSASFLRNVKQCFLLCYNRRTDNLHWLDHIQSGAAFITTFQLVAHTIGIGSCWIGHLPNKSEIRRLLAIPGFFEPVALVSFGYYRQRVRHMSRKHDAPKIIMKNRFDATGLVLEPRVPIFIRSVARYWYYKLPAVFRRRLKKYTAKYEKKFYYEVFD